MLVQDVMQTELLTITPETTLPEAIKLVQRRGVRHLPVVEGQTLVGIVSDRDLKRAMPSGATSLSAQELNYLLDRVQVGEFMTRTVITVAPIFPVEEAARLMVSEKISALPVTDGERLVGIVTETDVLALFARAMGALEPSSRLDVVMDDQPGALGRVVQAVEGSGAVISSIMTLETPSGVKEAVIRIATINPRQAIRALEAGGYTVRQPWRG
ncbi:MAG TPA: CBS and ACT domain-containing protein [Methylomirabilota bacterium]|nr:CBS and ACT domain-containing protein [Methylomirabilota bacterium]